MNTTGDAGDMSLADGMCADALGMCTLRAAIQQSNSAPGHDTIRFSIPGVGPHRIRVTSELPTVTDAATIDATTQPGYAGTPVVVLDGGMTSNTQIGPIVIVEVGVDFRGGSSILRGLQVEGFAGTGVLLSAGGGNRVESNVVRANGRQGIRLGGIVVDSSSNNVIGGTTQSARNVVTANTWDGIALLNEGATGNRILGNTIESNGVVGIRLSAAAGNTVGGTEPGAGNVVRFNGGNAIRIEFEDGGLNTIQGNVLGPANFSGVTIVSSPRNLVGGTAAGARNFIFGNTFFGVAIALDAATANRVEGNIIGVDPSGTRSGNGSFFDNSAGLIIEGASANVIGGTEPGARNVISGNNGDGIQLFSNGNDPGSTNANRILGNWIGLNPGGTGTIGNARSGVQLVGRGGGIVAQPANTGASQNIVGGLEPAARNVISGNAYGIGLGALPDSSQIGGVANENLIIGNYVGTDPTGTKDFGNTLDGIVTNGASRNIIGGLAPEARNVISGNGRYGIRIGGPGLGSRNEVLGNYVGTTADGMSPLKNDLFGIQVSDPNTVIGGTGPGAANLVASNGAAGVALPNNAAQQVSIRGNSIHSNGGLGIDLGANGVTPNDSGDADFGPNGRQNFPVISQASTTSGETNIQGTLSTAVGEYDVDLYSSRDCDPTGFGEGESFLASAPVVTDSGGNAAFNVTLDRVVPSSYLTASATEARGATSEFSLCFPLNPAELSVTLTDAPDPVLAGQIFTYTAIASNSGPNAATGVTVTDALPTSVTFLSATSSQGSCSGGQTVVCGLGGISAGGSATVTIQVRAGTTAPSTISNTVSVRGNESQANRSNDSATAATTVNPAADLAVRIFDSPDPVIAGSTLTYSLAADNRGPNTVTGLTVSDNLPSGTTFVSASASQGSCSHSQGTVTCALGTLIGTPNSVSTAFVTIKVTPQAPGMITNTALISGTQGDPDPSNNTATSTTLVKAGADLAVALQDAPDPVVAGSVLTYTATVANGGPQPATGAVFGQTLPPGTKFVSIEPTQGECAVEGVNVTCTLGMLASGESATVTTKVVPLASGHVSSDARVSAIEDDPVPSNNAVSAITTVDPGADLEVTQTDTPDPTLAGGDVTYTITVGNAGPDPATGVRLNDTIPSGTTLRSINPSQGSCGSGGGAVTCDLGGIGVGSQVSVEISVSAPQSPGTISNLASVFADQSDPDPSDNSRTEQTTVEPAADLSVSQTDAPDPARTGGTLRYTVGVTNAGPSDATSVILADTLPTGAEVVSVAPSQGTCEVSGVSVTCNLGSIAAGAGAVVEITVIPHEEGTAVNSASVAASEGDPDPSNNSATAQTTVVLGVRIDIRPDDNENVIRSSAGEIIPVAIISEGDFNAAMVDPSSVCFGDAQAPQERDCTEAHLTGHIEDVDGDGDLDLLLHYEFIQTGIDQGDVEACLTGALLGGRRFEGCDSIFVR